MLRQLAGPLALLLLGTVPAAFGFGEGDILHLELGAADRRLRTVPLVLDALTDAASGELISTEELVRRLSGVSLLLVGESHTDVETHQVQARVIEALQRTGRKLLIGLEMFPYSAQKPLDAWVQGWLTPRGFIEMADWYSNWGYRFDYYREIFRVARRHRIPMFGVNTPRRIVSAVRKKGFANLSREEAAHLPASIDTDSPEHRRLFRAFFAGSDSVHSQLSPKQWSGMFAAQCTWDATMAFNSTEILRKFQKQNPIMVVLVGSGHVAYGLGIQRQAAHWFRGEVETLIPVPVEDDDGKAVRDVQASYADFVWGIPRQVFSRYPSLGASTRGWEEAGGPEVSFVDPDSPAGRAGVHSGDHLISFQGRKLVRKSDLNRLVAGLQWGDEATLVLRRDGKEVSLQIFFRRLPPTSSPESE